MQDVLRSLDHSTSWRWALFGGARQLALPPCSPVGAEPGALVDFYRRRATHALIVANGDLFPDATKTAFFVPTVESVKAMLAESTGACLMVDRTPRRWEVAAGEPGDYSIR